MAAGYGTDSRYKSSLRQKSGSESRQKEKRRELKHSDSRSGDLNSSRNRSGRSQSSRGEKGSQTSLRLKSPGRLHLFANKEYDFAEHLLDEDFKLMMAMSPSPDEAFCPKSGDYTRATLWHNKLKDWECDTIYELRMRQNYMSYFSVCLNQQQLRGVFQQDPPERLIWVDFQEMIDPNAGCMSMGNESAWLTMISSMLQHEGSCCSQSTKAGQSRTTGGSAKRKYPQGTTLKLAYKSKPKLVPKNLSSSQSSSSPMSCDSKYCRTSSGSSLSPLEEPKNSAQSRQSRHRRPIDDQARKEMDYLLATIKSELRGEQLPEPDEYLELELKRYREFYARHRGNDPDFKSITAAVDSSKERIHMLLNMQTDLIKLLTEH
ncbi:uncharacterized protein LOC117789275 [Drosophila innubila]|uniref:uncharacterized protein LOC117789275 n=1 Tax=Drosophila innubila TaxID=198719 RepID=UPI00148C6551|nr:uncharacterized protein LOC117789275 [Drosophila innubila]